MSTQWNMAWLVRWRVRDRASCFLANRLPSDDHEMASSSHHVAVSNMVSFDKKKGNSFNSISNNNLSHRSKKGNKATRQLNSSAVKNDKDGVVTVGSRFEDSSWSLSIDEDFIVLCFREDGAFDALRDEAKGVDEKHHKKPRPVNRKLNYVEEEEQVSDPNIQEKISNDANLLDIDEQHYQDCLSFSKENNIEINRQQEQYRESIEEPGMVSAESSNSDKSEGSADSFAFPVLSWEWMESPVKMPKSGGIHQKKHKIRFVRFQCCRF